MTFLNPFLLFGLLAAAIPILLHIFNLRKLRTIEFSTLSFLKELQKTKIRRLKLRQLLLLFLRTLLVILIVLAFSRPALKGTIPGSLAEQAKTTAVLLFDDSQSMTASDEQGELLIQAKNTAAAIVNLLKEGDEIFLVKLSEIPLIGTKEIPSPQRNFAAVKSAINDISPSSIHRTIEDGLRFSARLLASSKNFNKEVYIISDFQSGSLESKLNAAKIAENLFEPATQFFLVPLGKREMQNVAVESVEIPNTIFEVNKPFLVKAKLTNHGTSDVQNHVVSVFQDGNRVAQKGIDIDAGQSVETDFTLVPKTTGYLNGTVELEDDDLEFDNRNFFTVRIPDQLRLLLVGGKSDLHYIRLALMARLSDSAASLKIAETTLDRFSSSQLNNTDVVVFSNPYEFSESQTASMQAYLQNGGGLLFFPGNQTTINAYNANIAGPLRISAIAPQESQYIQSQPDKSFIEFDKVDFRHPLFSGMFESGEEQQSVKELHRQRTLETPRIHTSFHFTPTPRSKVIITLSNGRPFLIEERTGSGRILLFSIAANAEWSNFPFKGLFVPLIHRAISYLAQEPTTERSLSAGDEAVVRLRTSLPPALTVTKPDAIPVLVTPIQRASEKSLRFSDTDVPGVYSVKNENTVYEKFAVNLNPDESNTAPADERRKEIVFKRIGIAANSIHTVHQLHEVQRIITESRFGAELWKQFLIAALITAIIEMFVARDTKRSLASTTSSTG